MTIEPKYANLFNFSHVIFNKDTKTEKPGEFNIKSFLRAEETKTIFLLNFAFMDKRMRQIFVNYLD